MFVTGYRGAGRVLGEGACVWAPVWIHPGDRLVRIRLGMKDEQQLLFGK